VHESAARLAVDTALWDQEGCLSPHVVFVESEAEELCARIAAHLDALEVRVPRGQSPIERAAAVRARTLAAEAASLADDKTRLWQSERWAVILDGSEPLQPSPLGRTLIVRPVADEAEMWSQLEPWHGHLQCLGVAGEPERFPHLTIPLRALGGTRLCAIGRMQEPGPLWFGEERDVAGQWHLVLEEEIDGVWSQLVSAPGRRE
jgi:hypothetical protein